MYSYIFNFLHLLLFDEFTSLCSVFVYLNEIFRNIFYDTNGNCVLFIPFYLPECLMFQKLNVTFCVTGKSAFIVHVIELIQLFKGHETHRPDGADYLSF